MASAIPFNEQPSGALTLEQLARVCQTGRVDGLRSTQSTGFSELNAALPGGGWPVGALTELMAMDEGIGEMQLLMPALAQLTRDDRYIALIDPPHLAYPPAWAQQGVRVERCLSIQGQSAATTWWAAEQMLRCPAVGAVLAWPSRVNDKNLRRLQLAAEAGRTLAILYRPLAAAAVPSPAALRLLLRADECGLFIEIKKCRGGRGGRSVRCIFDDALRAA
jgi:hypothetical protein